MNTENSFVLGEDVKKTINNLFHNKAINQSSIKYSSPNVYFQYIYNEYISPNLALIVVLLAIIFVLGYRYQNKLQTEKFNPNDNDNDNDNRKHKQPVGNLEYKNYDQDYTQDYTQDYNQHYPEVPESSFGRPTFNPTVPVSKQISYTMYPPNSHTEDLPAQYFPHSYPNYGAKQSLGPEYNGIEYRSGNDPQYGINSSLDDFSNWMVQNNRNNLFNTQQNTIDTNNNLITAMTKTTPEVNQQALFSEFALQAPTTMEPAYAVGYDF